MLISKTIDGALRLIGVLAAGEEANPEEHADGLERINSLIESFNLQSLLISYTKQVVLPALPIAKAKITIGKELTNDYVQVAPIEIIQAFFRDAGGMDYPIRLWSIDQWSRLVNKSIVARPTNYFVQYGNDNGMRSLELQFNTIPYPTDELHLMARMPYIGATGSYLPTDDIEWDYGFERMIRYNLAVELAPEYGIVDIPQIVIQTALTTLNEVKQSNYEPLAMEVDRGLLKRSKYYNNLAGINSGWAW